MEHMDPEGYILRVLLGAAGARTELGAPMVRLALHLATCMTTRNLKNMTDITWLKCIYKYLYVYIYSYVYTYLCICADIQFIARL